MVNFKAILVIMFVLDVVYCNEMGKLVKNYESRHRRRCGQTCSHLPANKHYYALLKHAFHNPFIIVLFLFIALILILMLLGFIKGVIGLLCIPRVGMMGLNLLIDLPRPLSKYQEKKLADRPVKYDIAGWPVHPDTDMRTVRPITRRTEFCLNLVFFLSYPLAILIRSCAMCCTIKNYNDDEDAPLLSSTRIIRITNCCNKFKKKPPAANRECTCQPCSKIYSNEDQEKEDTDYVVAMLKKSEESLNKVMCSCSTKQPKKIKKERVNNVISDTKYEADDEGENHKLQ